MGQVETSMFFELPPAPCISISAPKPSYPISCDLGKLVSLLIPLHQVAESQLG